ncbi:MAG TPA: DUF3352 domain-containing protein [Thermomicrobiaceae bacterium]|nr:DUF3352 domain-containing protein [Thermomicrobiaceae bacterium]
MSSEAGDTGGNRPGQWSAPAGGALRRLAPAAAPGGNSSLEWPPPTPPRSWRRVRLAALAGALLLALAAGGVYAAYHFLFAHADRATAAYVPSGALAYVALNTDPTSHAWVDAWMLARRAGIDDVLANLPDENLNDSSTPDAWESLVKPAIGGEVGLAAWPDGQQVDGAAIVLFSDAGKARLAIAPLLGDGTLRDASHRGISYQVNERGEAAGVVDHALVLASRAQAFDAVIDARLDGATLAGQPRFQTAAEHAAADPLIFGWVDTPAVAKTLGDRADSSVFGAAGINVSPWRDYQAIGTATITIKAEDDALRAVVLTEGRPASFPAPASGDDLAGSVPAATLFYATSADLYHSIWQPLIEPLRQEAAQHDPTTFGAYDPANLFGIDLEHGLLAHLTGRYALAVQAGNQGGESWSVQFLSRVDDAKAVQQTLDQAAIVAQTQFEIPLQGQPDGYQLSQDGSTLDLTLKGDLMRFSIAYGAPPADGALAGDPAYRQAMAGMPADASYAGYVALNRIVPLLAERTSEADNPALTALNSAAYVIAPDGAGTRSELALFLKTK